MNNTLSVFKNSDFGEVRTTIIDGEIWFVGKDVATALGYANPRKAIADHVDEEDKGVTKCYTLGGEQELTIINESGLYSLTLSSQLADAKKFKRWITKEVIPAIRKTGCYSVDDNTDAGNDENINEAGIENVMETRKPSIVTMAKAFSIMVESMDRTMGLCMQEKLNLYRFFCTTYGLPAPKDLPTEESCNSAASLLKRFGCDLSVQLFNKVMANRGLMTNNTAKVYGKEFSYKTLTKDGLEYGYNKVKPGTSITRPVFLELKFKELLDFLGLKHY